MQQSKLHAYIAKILTGTTLILAVASTATSIAGGLPITAAPEGARVSIISPVDGEIVEAPFTVLFALAGMGVAPAGTDRAKTGHHHLLIDQAELPKPGQPMGNPPLHFGGGQTQTTLNLESGKHTLQLIMGDKIHIPHQPPVISEKITIIVK